MTMMAGMDEEAMKSKDFKNSSHSLDYPARSAPPAQTQLWLMRATVRALYDERQPHMKASMLLFAETEAALADFGSPVPDQLDVAQMANEALHGGLRLEAPAMAVFAQLGYLPECLNQRHPCLRTLEPSEAQSEALVLSTDAQLLDAHECIDVDIYSEVDVRGGEDGSEVHRPLCSYRCVRLGPRLTFDGLAVVEVRGRTPCKWDSSTGLVRSGCRLGRVCRARPGSWEPSCLYTRMRSI